MNGSRSCGRTPIPVKPCFTAWVQYRFDGVLLGEEEEPKIGLEGKNILGPSFHQRTVSVGFTVCGLEWPPETPAAPRPQFSRTHRHTKVVNLEQKAPDRTPFVLPGASSDTFPGTSHFAPPEKGLKEERVSLCLPIMPFECQPKSSIGTKS